MFFFAILGSCSRFLFASSGAFLPLCVLQDQESDKLSGGFIGTDADADTVVTADDEERESLAAGESSTLTSSGKSTVKSPAKATIAGEVASTDAGEAAVADAENVEKEHFCRRLGNVLGNWVFLSLALGYAAQNFVVGAFSYFGIQYVVTVLKFSVAIAGLAFGLMTLFTGVLGIWFGGWWLDRLRRDCLADDLKSTEKSVKSLLIMTLLALPFAGASFIVGPKYPIVFFVLIAPGEFFLFATVAPINAAFMWCVHPFYRTLAVACSVFIQHLLGDAPSPVVVGWLIDFTGSMTTALIIAAGWLLFSVILFGVAYHLIYTQNRKRDEANGVLPDGEENANGGDDDAGVVSRDYRKRRPTATDADAVFRDAAGGGGGGDDSGTAMRRPSRGGDSAAINVYDALRTTTSTSSAQASSSMSNEFGDETDSDLQHH